MHSEARVKLVKAQHVWGAWMMWERQVQPEVLLSSPTLSVPLLFLCFPGNLLLSQHGTSRLLIFLRSILLLPWLIYYRHLGLDEGSNSVRNSHHFS